MAYWFHRNPLKATAAISFNLKMIIFDREAIQICDKLKSCRSTLLEMLSDPVESTDQMEQTSSTYLSLIGGLVENPDLRYALRFRWTDSLLGNLPTAKQDVMFEVASICLNLAIWYSKHAAVLANKEDINMEQAKAVHTCLRRAAGIFLFLKETQCKSEAPRPGSDFDPQVLNTYIEQCTAEAQEVAIARAVELKHSQSLISSLAFQTSDTYTKADGSLLQLDVKIFGKWRLYLRTKAAFYLSLAYCYHGESLLSQEQCGEAIRAVQESQSHYDNARKLCEDYNKIKGPGTAARPAEHPFFCKLGPLLQRTLEKCLRENGFIYHQKVSQKVCRPENRVTYGLADPIAFQLPECSPLWTTACSAAFAKVPRLGGNDPASSQAAVAAEGELVPVQEVSVHQSQVQPTNHSGCLIQ